MLGRDSQFASRKFHEPEEKNGQFTNRIGGFQTAIGKSQTSGQLGRPFANEYRLGFEV